MRVTGHGFGDADPPEDAEFYFDILTLNGDRQQMLMDMVTPTVEIQLIAEYQQHLEEAAL
jgi:hypothetical protein